MAVNFIARRTLSVEMAGSFRLIVDFRHFHAANTCRHLPLKLVADTVAEHACAARRQDRKLAHLSVRLIGKYKRDSDGFARLQIDEFGTRIHCHDIGWHSFGINDFSALQFFDESIKVASRALIGNGDDSKQIIETLFVLTGDNNWSFHVNASCAPLCVAPARG
jgi:hypothetical protein